MSPRRCAIDGCKSVSNHQQHQGVRFHTFPVNSEVRKKWIESCRIASDRIITKSVLVCSRHFRRADFQPLKNDKYFLKNGVVPTIFPWGDVSHQGVSTSSIKSTNTGTTTTVTGNAEDIPKAGDNVMVVSTRTTMKKTSARSKLIGNIDTNLKQRSASAEEQSTGVNSSSIDKINARKSLDSATVGVSGGTAGNKSAVDKSNLIKSPQKRIDMAALFVSGAKLEAQDFNGSWHDANVVEVDHGEQEVLINFEKNIKSKGPALTDEWIPMNSSRLRPIEVNTTPKNKKVELQFAEGERCLARWTDSRKFPATVQKVLENNMFEVLFDDGFPKTVKGSHMSKLRRPISDKTQPIITTPPIKKPIKAHPIPKYDLSQFNLPEIPSDGEWCCPWVNDTPIGREGYLINADGNKRPTVLVDDWRLPNGWIKHLYQRSSVSGKWDVVLVGPNNKRFRSKNDVKVYLEENGLVYNPDVYDFSIHKRRAKDIGVYVYTGDYVPPIIPKPGSDCKVDTSFSSPIQEIKQESFSGFPPVDSPSPSITSITNEIKNECISPTAAVPTVPPPLEEGYIYVGALKVQIVDNLFRCPKDGCNKNFRKENHLQIHVKHYHDELSKQLGACPNMTELAYFRTMGTPIDESTPKNQIPNSQFFEKVYQSELKITRKSSSPPQIKSEIKSEEQSLATDLVLEAQAGESLKRKSSTDLRSHETKEKKKSTLTDRIISESIESTQTAISSTNASKAPISVTPVKKSEQSSSELAVPSAKPQIHRFKIAKVPNKVGRKKGSKNLKKKFKKFGKGLKRKALEALVSRASLLNENTDCEETRQSAGPAITLASKDLPLRTNRLKFLQYSPLDSPYENPLGALTEHSNSPRYINENGELIKIVRMRQEEIINCLCSYGEEDGLMIQCELCLCWQHGGCNGIEKESEVPDKYVCYICRNPTRGRESMKYIHDQDWLYEGKLFHANYHQPSKYATQRFDILKHSHTLTGNLLDLRRSLHSLNVKINIAANKDHPKMYLWSKKWEQSPPRINNVLPDAVLKLEPKSETLPDELIANKNEEICPFATPEKVKKDDTIDQLKLEIGNTQVKSTPTIARKDIEEDGSILANLLTSPDAADDHTILSNVDKRNNDILTETQQLSKQIVPQLPATTQVIPNIPEPEAAIDPVECQHRLLEHIQKEQNLILSRMQTIDAQIIALEAMDDHPDINSESDFARTSQTIHLLLNDLTKLRKLAIINQSSINTTTAIQSQFVI